MNKEASKKALLEVGRVIVLGVIAWLITGGLDLLLGSVEVDPVLKVQITALLLLILKGLDKWLHEKGKDENKDKLVKGITRF
ncbi:unnamed protein product [marine sediment metagenome]|uniref:Holin n=1 Tax=marine sediment metagenome TaxID=412755 RepID=X1HA08_9ZZZZ